MELGNWIPQFFYDLIGRVVPGAVLTLASFLLLQDTERAKCSLLYLFHDSGISGPALYLAGLLVFYVIGTLLGALGFAITETEWNTKKIAKIVERPQLDPLSFARGIEWNTKTMTKVADQPDLPDSVIAYMYDAILWHSPAAGARLAKLRAEQHMCRVLIVGLLLLVALYSAAHAPAWQSWTYWRHIALILFGIGTSYLFYVHLAIRVRRLMLNCWDLIPDTEVAKKRCAQAAHKPPQPTT